MMPTVGTLNAKPRRRPQSLHSERHKERDVASFTDETDLDTEPVWGKNGPRPVLPQRRHLEIYNLTNQATFGNPRGTKNSHNFPKTIVADKSRTTQLGFRLTF